jgi:hypothetical protein
VTNVILKTAVLAGFCAAVACAMPRTAADTPGRAEALYLKLQSVGLDKTRVYKVRDGALDRGRIHIALDDGTIAFTADVDGRVTGAFFRGDGEVLLSPPNATERQSLALFTGAAILEEKFSTAYFRFNDDAYGELKNSLRPPEDAEGFVTQSNTTASNLASEDALRLLTSFINISIDNSDHFLHAIVQGERLGTFDVRYDSFASEQVSAAAHRTVKGEDFYDVWTSFALPEGAVTKNGAGRRFSSLLDFDISNFNVEAQVQPPTQLDAKAVLTIVPRHDGRKLLLFELSRLLQIKHIEADGQAVEFIHNPAIEGSQLARRGNDNVAVMLPTPVRAGHKVELTFTYSGAVLSEAANGLLYVGEHGTWYPNIGFVKASYDLEFRYPADWILVATGKLVSAKTAGAEQTSRWVSERPIPVAGFNLGKYSRATARAGNASVVTYATANVERNFPAMQTPQAPPHTFLGNREASVGTPDREIPSPARNAQNVANAAAKALEFYQQRFGPFPYGELSLTQFPANISQGWPGLVFLASYAFLTGPERENFQPDPKLRLALEQTTAHEVAHQWWGDLVNWDGYRDQWTMEALANYSAMMLLESRNPTAFRELMQKFRDDLLIKRDKGQQVTDAGPVTLGIRLSSSQFPEGYPAISYGRGTWLIHMLRCMLRDADRGKTVRTKASSDEAFLRALRKVREQYENRPVTTSDLVNIFASELPGSLSYEGRKSLDWFYDGWVNGSSVPEFSLHDVKFSSKAGAAVVTGTIRQEYAPESLVTSVPVFAVIGGRNVYLARVFVEGPETQFHLTAPAGARKLIIDPEQTLLSRK